MKRILLLIVFGIAVNAYAETLYLKDGQIIKGSLAESLINVHSAEGDGRIEKDKISQIEFNDNINLNDSCTVYLHDKDTKELYEEFKFRKIIQEEKRAKRAKSIFSIGIGLGLPYGWAGYNVEGLIRGKLGLTAGLGCKSDESYFTYGARWYFGAPGDRFRCRLTGLIGDVGEINYYEYNNYYFKSINERIKGKAAYLGFTWKMAVWLSLNFDIGYAVSDSNERVVNDYYGQRTISFVERKTVASIGFNTHF